MKTIICKTDGAEIMVDDEDYPILSRFPWYRGGGGKHPMTFFYGKRDTSQTVYMHQIIMGGAVNTDHRDQNVLNMQKENLRPSTNSQNGANSPASSEITDVPDEETRSGRLERLTEHLPTFPHTAEQPWVWIEDDIKMLRAACAKRFDEALRTESLFCIAATGIRIYLSRAAKAPATGQAVTDYGSSVGAKMALSTNPPAHQPDEVSYSEAVKICKDRADYYERTSGMITREDVARSYKATADKIARLPVRESVPRDEIIETIKELHRPCDIVEALLDRFAITRIEGQS